MNKYFNQNKLIIITGASSGIGKSLTSYLIKKYSLTVVGIGRNEENLNSLVKEFNDNFIPFKMDVSQKEEWLKLESYLQTLPNKPSGLINCAGVLPDFLAFEKVKEETVYQVFNVNFFSIIFSCQTILPILKTQQNPILINVSSSSSLCPFAGVSLYSSSKAAVKNFSESLSVEKNGVKVVTVMPGFTKTDVMRSIKRSRKEQRLIDKISLSPDKVAKKIIKKASKGKVRIITGIDAHFMNFLYKFFPKTAPKFLSWFLRKTKLDMFKKI